MEDTIAAISTALGVGAISIIRISGPDSLNIVNNLFDKDLTKAKTHTIHYGHIINNNQIVDEVLVSVMLAPKTFTKEDVIEINCHGGISTTNKVLELLLTTGARLAEPGEFTKRAFLNGRIDLTEAEGIMNLIEAKSDISRQLSINQLTGSVSNLIEDLRTDLINIISNIEVNIDYPEYEDIETMTNEKLKPKIENVIKEIKKIIKESENGKVLTSGIKTVIIGRPNVGKSSLLNRLLDEEKAIVTDIEGTTRDIVEGSIVLDGIILNMIDTAGIRDTKDVVESIGVKKSIELINKSDLVLFVLNNNDIITDKELEILELLKDKNYILVINKCDLESKLELPKDVKNIIRISALEDKGIDELKNFIKKIYNLENIETEDLTYLSNARSISLLEKAYGCIEEIEKGLDNNMPIDMVEIDIKNMWSILGEIIGETYQDELINQLFSQFCLGK